MMRWLVAAALFACSQPKPQPAPAVEASPCPRVADHLVSLMTAATKHPPEATDPLRRAINTRCTQDRWSAQTSECLLALTTLAEGQRCQATMSEAQVTAFQRDTEAATVELRSQFSEQPPADAGVRD